MLLWPELQNQVILVQLLMKVKVARLSTAWFSLSHGFVAVGI